MKVWLDEKKDVWGDPHGFVFDLEGNKVGHLYYACGGYRCRPMENGEVTYGHSTGAGDWFRSHRDALADTAERMGWELISAEEAKELQS